MAYVGEGVEEAGAGPYEQEMVDYGSPTLDLTGSGDASTSRYEPDNLNTGSVSSDESIADTTIGGGDSSGGGGGTPTNFGADSAGEESGTGQASAVNVTATSAANRAQSAEPGTFTVTGRDTPDVGAVSEFDGMAAVTIGVVLVAILTVARVLS